MAYRLEHTAAARRDLEGLPPAVLRRIDARLQGLAEHPRPRAMERLRGSRTLWRLRVGDYRIIYEINDADQVITPARIRHRWDVYRELWAMAKAIN